LFIGDGVSDGFSVAIPQATSSLYSVLLKFFENGVETTSAALGITYTITKLSTAVSVFLSDPLPTTVYVSLYVSRGFYEGLEPTFGYQDPSGIVFEPTPATYQHFFARLITEDYDPSVDMVGCPTPEERVLADVEDVFTIAIRSFPENFTDNIFLHLDGQQTAAQVGSLAFTLISSPNTPLPSLRGISEIGTFAFEISGASPISGLEVVSSVGIIIPGVPLDGLVSTSDIGVFTFDIDSEIDTIGLATTTEIGDFSNRDIDGLETDAEFGDLIPMAMPAILSNVANTEFATLAPSQPLSLVGGEVTATVGSPSTRVSIGQFATGETGEFVLTISKNLTGTQVTARAGRLQVDPFLVQPIGVEATTGIGSMSASIS
jgi:hypothetical protein